MRIANLHRIFATVGMLLLTVSLCAQIPADCADKQQTNNWPEFYCDCKYAADTFQLPLDIQISDARWFKGTISDLSQGISAYLNSDCPMMFEVYPFCTSKTSEYEKIFEQNTANTIDGASIKQRLEEAGYGSAEGTFYICISPINGLGGRLILRSEADGMPSSCLDPLSIYPGMTLYSTQATDVYVVDPSNIEEANDIIIFWDGGNGASCELQLTSNSCDGTVVDEVTLDATNNCYTLTAKLLDEAWFNDEKFYLHFNHAPNTAGYVRCLVPEYSIVYTDTTICQGMGIQLADTLLTESTTYCVDTVFLHTNQYRVNYLRVTVVEPEIEPDTMAFKYTQQPYLYRNQHTISKPGNYDLTIHIPGQCDEQYALHVYHDIDTLVNVVDTFLCYGASFEYNGKLYLQDVSLGTSTWKNQDTLIFDTINVYFATTPEIVYDTIMQYDYKYGKTFKQTGDFAFIYTNPTTYCVDSIYLHVLPGVDDGVKYDYYYIDTTLCQGMEYEDYYGNLYATSTVLYDTIWRIPNKHCEIEITTITFTESEIQFDTISIKTTQLPYKYNKYCTVDTFGIYDYVVHVDGRCDERYQLLVCHDIDTIYQSLDTTICQGKSYTYEGLEYTTDITLVDTLQLDADTYQILTTNVLFTVPEITPDTLALKTTDLPYTYRNQYVVDDFGMHDVLLSLPEVCDEHYLLHVSHDIDTLTQSLDTTLCQGMVYLHNGVEYTTATTFMDSAWVNDDTFALTTVSVTFLAPETQNDTLSLRSTDLPYTYRNQHTITTYGDYDLTIHVDGECDERYQLLVLHDIDTLTQSLDTTLCQGMAYLYNGVEYTTDTTLIDTLQHDADTYQILTIQVSFLVPDIQPDTISLKTTDLPYTYRNQYVVDDFGEHDVLISLPDVCDEHYALYVWHDLDTIVASVDTVLCQGKAYVHNGVAYTASTILVDTLQLDADTYQILTTNVLFTAPEITPDTLALKTTDLPYTYRSQYVIPVDGLDKDYDVLIHTQGVCDERYLLHVYHQIDTILQSLDTTLCMGRVFIFDEYEYTEPTTVLDSIWLNDDTWQITTLNLAFTAPTMEYDTIWLSSVELLEGYYYEPADTMVHAAGEYFYEILTYNDCTRHLTLTVNEKIPSVLDNIPVSNRPRLIMRDGMVYILYGEECFTILGVKLGS